MLGHRRAKFINLEIEEIIDLENISKENRNLTEEKISEDKTNINKLQYPRIN